MAFSAAPWPLHRVLREGEGARELAERMRRAVSAGQVPGGARLPASRELAVQLGVGRNGIVAAYAHGVAEGWLEGRGRHGTFVVASSGPKARQWGAASAGTPTLARRLSAPPTADVPPHADWRLGQAGTLALPLRVWRAACKEAGRHLLPCDYGDPRGDLALREGIARWLFARRGLDVAPRQVVVTLGASQAIEQLAGLLLRPGDLCVVENPGYTRAARIFAASGASVIGAPVDAEGLHVEQAFAGDRAPAILHLTPAQHHPLGMRLSGPRRQRLLDLARRHGTLIVENEYDHEFAAPGPYHTPLWAAAPQQTVLVSTFAKAVSPALRLGFLVAPDAMADRLADRVADERTHVSWPVQRSVAWLLASGELDRHLRRVRRHGQQLREFLQTRLRRWHEAFGITAHASGQHVLLSATTATRSRALQRALRQQGVRVDALDAYSIAPSAWHGVLMSYGHMTLPQLRKALDVFEQALKATR